MRYPGKQIAMEPRTEEEAAIAGHYYGSRWCAKLAAEDEDLANEAAIWAVIWWRDHRGSVDMWTFMKRRLADLCRRLGVYYIDGPTNEQIAAGEALGGHWDGNVLHGVRLKTRSARGKAALAVLRGGDDLSPWGV